MLSQSAGTINIREYYIYIKDLPSLLVPVSSLLPAFFLLFLFLLDVLVVLDLQLKEEKLMVCNAAQFFLLWILVDGRSYPRLR